MTDPETSLSDEELYDDTTPVGPFGPDDEDAAAVEEDADSVAEEPTDDV